MGGSGRARRVPPAVAVLLCALLVGSPVARAAGAALPPGASGFVSTGRIDLFYGRSLTPGAWYRLDARQFAALHPRGPAGLRLLYNQWLAIADLRAALYTSAGQPQADGVVVYPPGPSAVLHVLDLALWARERALLFRLGVAPRRGYPKFADLGYRDATPAVGSHRRPDVQTPARIGALIAALPLSGALFAGDRIFLMPYRLPQEYGVTDVYGPGIRVWLAADAQPHLRHVLYHELAHTMHFRYGGYDTTAGGQPLSAFWRTYLAIRGLRWHDPTLYPWAQQTPECFAEDFAFVFRHPGGLGYQAACPPPTAAQRRALLRFWSGLPSQPNHSPFAAADWVRWRLPWPSPAFGNFTALDFTAGASLQLRLALAPQASAGPYTVQVAGGKVLTTLRPGAAWASRVAVPRSGGLEIDAQSPTLVLSSLQVWRNAAFVPVPRVSGVFVDTLSSWARAGIAAAVRHGVVGGYPDGRFRPNAKVTRAEMARMLATGLRTPLFGPGRNGFADVPQTSWAAPFVDAVGNLLPGVTPHGRFHPGRPLQRQQAVAWLVRSYGWPAVPAAQVAGILAPYPGGNRVAAPDAPWFARAVLLGLVRGGATGALHPRSAMTRAQAAVLVMRALHLKQG